MFRAEKVKSITVSSVSMGQYFQPWLKDILIAFPINWHEMDALMHGGPNHVESSWNRSNRALFTQHLRCDEVWIKIDVGAHRGGIDWQDEAALAEVVKAILDSKKMSCAVLPHVAVLTHAKSVEDVTPFTSRYPAYTTSAKKAEPSPQILWKYRGGYSRLLAVR